jgi:predicted nucleotidyltransferase
VDDRLLRQRGITALPASLPADLEAVLGRLERGLEGLYGARYRGLVLYGSYARGEAHDESDVDLLLLLRGPVDRAREVLRVEDVKWPLSLESGYVLSVLPVGVEEFREAREPFLWNARAEGVLRG